MSKPVWPGATAVPQLPFKRLFTRVKRPVPHDAQIVTAYTDGQVTLRSNRAKERYHEASDLSTYQGVEVGDFVVHGLDIMRGSVGVADSSGAMSPVCVVCQPTPMVDPRYVAYAMRLQAAANYPKALARGVRDGGADFRRWETLAELPIPCPPVEYQRSISDFLDRATAKIDAVIEKQRALVNGLRGRRQAFLNSQFQPVNMSPLRRDVQLVTSGSRGWAEHYADEGIPFVRIGNLSRGDISLKLDDMQYVDLPERSEGSRTELQQGDLLFSITAYLGSVAVVPTHMAGAYVSQHVGLVRLGSKLWLPEYAAYFTLSDLGQEQLQSSSYGGTKVQIALDDLRAFRVPVLPINDQMNVVIEIRSELSRIDALIARSERLIELSQERRSALITAAVTGQLDIPSDTMALEGAA